MKQEDALKLADEALKGLAAELQNGKSQTLIQFLEVMARFPNYSFRNVMLILAQCPEATRVAGFRTWKSLGRFVRQGERGSASWPPWWDATRNPRTAEITQGDQRSDQVRLFGFRIVHVFDISQTEGAELPDLTQPAGDPGDNLAKLEGAVRGMGITLEYAPIPEGALGMSLKGKIVVQPNLTPAEKFAVLAHELGHEVLHPKSDQPRSSKTIRELEAESVAHVVCHAFGIESTTRSSDYIQLYDGDVGALNGSLQAIQSAAARIIMAVSKSDALPQAGLATLAA